jgi:hypothetical protein
MDNLVPFVQSQPQDWSGVMDDRPTERRLCLGPMKWICTGFGPQQGTLLGAAHLLERMTPWRDRRPTLVDRLRIESINVRL